MFRWVEGLSAGRGELHPVGDPRSPQVVTAKQEPGENKCGYAAAEDGSQEFRLQERPRPSGSSRSHEQHERH